MSLIHREMALKGGLHDKMRTIFNNSKREEVRFILLYIEKYLESRNLYREGNNIPFLLKNWLANDNDSHNTMEISLYLAYLMEFQESDHLILAAIFVCNLILSNDSTAIAAHSWNFYRTITNQDYWLSLALFTHTKVEKEYKDTELVSLIQGYNGGIDHFSIILDRIEELYGNEMFIETWDCFYLDLPLGVISLYFDNEFGLKQEMINGNRAFHRFWREQIVRIYS